MAGKTNRMTEEIIWRCCGCGVPTPNRIRACDCPTNCVSTNSALSRTRTAWKVNQKHARLSETIRTRLLGVRPEDQDVVLEDEDWRLILELLT